MRACKTKTHSGCVGLAAERFYGNEAIVRVEQLQQRAAARRVNGWLRAGLARKPALLRRGAGCR